MISTRRNTYRWPNWRKPSGYPPGQPYPGFLKERRAAIKRICKARREHKRNMRKAQRANRA